MAGEAGYVCMDCLFVGPAEEFQTNNEDLAPDLADSWVCPECGEGGEDISDIEFE